MRFGSLFSGIGGIDLGLERAGMECAWQVEIDSFCQKVLTKHWPDVPKFGDIRDVGKNNLETVDLIAGGFPCQPFSDAGKRKGTEDDRHLWPEMLRVISELRPTWVIAENVPGIINIFLYQALFDLAREGYKALPIVLPACGFDAPHQRYRLFIVAHSMRERWGGGGNENAQGQGWALQTKRPGSRNEQRILANPNKERLEVQQCEPGNNEKERQAIKRNGNGRARWLSESRLGRVAHGIPDRVDRLKGLGNAVVPQVAEHIGKMIMEANNDLCA